VAERTGGYPVALDVLPEVSAGPAAGAGSARDGVLVEVYWRLHDHAAAYRDTEGVRRCRERWQANRDDPEPWHLYAVHEFYARGINAAARDVEELLGVPEREIERPEVPGGQ